MQEEQDTCRICSAPAEPDQPLFYPCKCSGTIRYIHQDCLTTWLAHSKKKTCDVCKYPYTFTKVYSPDMPARLPITLVIRKLIQQAGLGVLFGLRGVLVATVWLAFLPWATVWTWRMYFATGDATAWWISNRPKPEHLAITEPSLNATTSSFHEADIPPISPNATLLTTVLLHPAVRSVSADIVTGQIIASVIILGFVAVFLLREWIAQNARPGVFDDAEPPPEPEVAVPHGDVAELAHDIGPPPVEPVRVRPRPENLPVPAAPRPANPFQADHRRHRIAIPNHPRVDPKVNPTPDEGIPESDDIRKVRRRLESPERRPSPRARSLPRRMPSSSNGKAPMESQPLDLKPEQQEFTFNFKIPEQKVAPEAPEVHRDDDMFYHTPTRIPVYDEPVEPGGLRQVRIVAPDLSGHYPPRRPPMPGISLPPHVLASPSTVDLPRSRINTPLASPGLASYSAPEEIEAGPSRGYFGPENLDEETLQEFERYFAQQRSDVPGLVDAGPAHVPHDVVDVDHDGLDSADTSQEIPQHWSDDEFEEEEEEEDHEDAIIPFGVPPPGEDPDADLNGDGRNALRDDRPGEPENGRDVNRVPQPDGDGIDPDDMDANIEDDMDGALEAIGLRGPIYGVLQNAAFMTFVLDATLGILVWLPFTIGKTVALLSLDPARMVEVIHAPIRAIRFITDPIVDLVSWFLTITVVLPLSHLILQGLTAIMGLFITSSDRVVEASPSLFNRTLEAFNVVVDQSRTFFLPPDLNDVTLAAPTLFERLAENDSSFFHLAEPYFAPIGETVRTQYQLFTETWVRLATSDTTGSKVFAIVLGYSLDILIMAIYLNVLTFGSVKSVGRAVRNAMRQQLLVLKVAIFIIIELVVFPLGCGVMLDACSVWLLPHGSLRSRVAFLTFAPLTAAFYHWVIGTMFMYQFAVLLAGCRSIMRAGAMWFIKDPQDQNFHPIRDILERPTFVQIKKLLLSAVMYGIVVAFSTATFSGILKFFRGTIMPFRWRILEPLSEIPIDLLLFHLVLPYTLHYFRPRKRLTEKSIALWKYLAHQLRLTSYMFGGRVDTEEYTPKHWSWKNLVFREDRSLDKDIACDGTFWRVPNHDNIAQVRNERAIIEVDVEGQPIDDEGRRLMALLDAEATKAKRDIKTDFTVVYVPPNFRRRIIVFILCLWVVGAIFLAGSLAVPIVLGRALFRAFTSRPIHDGYSFIVGFYSLWAAYLFYTILPRMDRHRQRHGGELPRASFPLYLAKRGLLWFAKIFYLAFFFGVVIPTLVALVVELYLVLPIRHAYNPEMKLRIRMVDMWALGLLYSKIALRAHRMQPDGFLARGIEQLRRHGWTHPDPIRATKEVIVPLIGGLIAMILAPPSIVWLGHKLLRLPLEESSVYLSIYPALFAVAGCTHGIVVLSSLMGTWSQAVRDKEFLMEMRLQNLESEAERKSQGTQTEKV
ncbi:hypothetical protein QCA50_008976 [Cerrena zonata]|uniref:RING-type E3 ubiquitin transferase n=1 Tax=Cerrena zonata TaxID=2478898 RepID=A0AAW0G5W0_9APHY